MHVPLSRAARRARSNTRRLRANSQQPQGRWKQLRSIFQVLFLQRLDLVSHPHCQGTQVLRFQRRHVTHFAGAQQQSNKASATLKTLKQQLKAKEKQQKASEAAREVAEQKHEAAESQLQGLEGKLAAAETQRCVWLLLSRPSMLSWLKSVLTVPTLCTLGRAPKRGCNGVLAPSAPYSSQHMPHSCLRSCCCSVEAVTFLSTVCMGVPPTFSVGGAANVQQSHAVGQFGHAVGRFCHCVQTLSLAAECLVQRQSARSSGISPSSSHRCWWNGRG